MNPRAHIRFGLIALAAFATIGLALEAMNGFKLGFYVSTPTRRLMLTLGHAHGVGLAIWNVVFGGLELSWRTPRRARASSFCLRAATVLLPGGFLLGGAWVYGGDPGLGFALIPVGAVLLVVHLVLSAMSATA